MEKRRYLQTNSDSLANSYTDKESNSNESEVNLQTDQCKSGELKDIPVLSEQRIGAWECQNHQQGQGNPSNQEQPLVQQVSHPSQVRSSILDDKSIEEQESQLIQRDLSSRLRGSVDFRRSSGSNSYFDFERISLESCYTPFKYPGNKAEAKFHAEANLLGQAVEENALLQIDQKSTSPFMARDQQRECHCCGKVKKEKHLSFWNLNYDCITESYGESIVYLFRMNLLFIVCICVIVCIYFVYFQLQVEKLCTLKAAKASVSNSTEDTCIKLLYWSILSELQLRRESELGVQIVLADLKFVLLIVLQVMNIVYFQSSNFLKTRSKKNEHALTKLRKKSLILQHIPKEYSENEIKKNIQLLVRNTYNVSVNVACVTSIFNCYEKYKLANSRMELLEDYYFNDEQCNALAKPSVKQKKMKELMKIRSALAKNQTSFKQAKKEFGGVLIVTFSSEYDRKIVETLLDKSYFLDLVHSVKRFFRLTTDMNTTRRMLCIKAPQLNEIIWQNIGSSSTAAQMQLYLLIAVFTLCIFLVLPRITEWLYKQQFSQVSQKQSFSDKYVDYGVSASLFTISNIVWLGMKYLLRKSTVSTTFYQSVYLLISNLAFHLQFYIIVPIFLSYFTQDFNLETVSYEKINIRLYGIATLIAGFSGLSVIDIMCGTPAIWKWIHRRWKLRNNKQYFQQRLNEAYQRASFPIEKRVLVLYKQYAFGIVVSFISPISWLFVLLGLIFQFIGNRFSLVKYFTMYTYYNTKVINKATRISSLALMYVVTILYLQTEKQSGFYQRDYYIEIAKYMLIFNVLANIIVERIYKAIIKRKKTIKILQEKHSARNNYINKTNNQKRDEEIQQGIVSDVLLYSDNNEEAEALSLYKYYNVYQSFLSKIQPSWSNDRVERIVRPSSRLKTSNQQNFISGVSSESYFEPSNRFQ